MKIMYSPKIQEEYVRAMYWIKEKTGLSIVAQANRAIMEYLKKNRANANNGLMILMEKDK